MYEGLSSPNIYNLKTIAEYATTIQSHPDARIWAGGSYILSQPDAYPSRINNEDIIYLGEVEELKRTQRNDRLLEYGAMVSLNTILNSNKSGLPLLLEENITSIGSSLITSRATIGGAICAPGTITSIPGTLIALGANVEIRYAKKKRIHSRWLPLSRTLDKNGRISLPPKSLVSRVRVALNTIDIQRYFSIGSLMRDPDEAVIVAFASDWNQDTLVNPHLVVTFPSHGILYSRDIDTQLSSSRFPLDDDEYRALQSVIFSIIEATFPNITPLQKARVKGIFGEIVNDLNNRTLTVSQDLAMEQQFFKKGL